MDGPQNGVELFIKEAGLSDWQQMATRNKEIYELLLKRGFPRKTPILQVANKVLEDTNGTNSVAKYICGTYYKMCQDFNGRLCYQRVAPSTPVNGRIACSGIYIFWSDHRKSWKIGILDDGKAGFAFNSDDKPSPAEVTQPWMVMKEQATHSGAAAETTNDQH